VRASVIANSAIRARRLRPETLDRVAALKALTRAERDHSGSGAFIARVRHQCLAQKVSRISAPNATKTRTGIALTRDAVLDAELAIGNPTMDFRRCRACRAFSEDHECLNRQRVPGRLELPVR